jgi:hypothetical protein
MDIDIDIPPSVKLKDIFNKRLVFASMVNNETKELVKHPCGVFFQTMPTDPVTGFAAIPYDESSDYNYFKIDMLNNNALLGFPSKEWMDEYIDIDPDWSLLLEEENVRKLFHLKNWHHVVVQVKPKSILELADVMALIRPSKQVLLDKYLRNRKDMRALLYLHVEKHDMRKSHCLAYALIIVLQLHLIGMGKL